MNKHKILTVNCSWEKTNYGAVLTAYALQNFLSATFNFNNELIYNPPQYLKHFNKYQAFQSFKDKYLKYTKDIVNIKSLIDLNKEADIFLTGSDQVFRFPFINGIKDGYSQYLLDFVDIYAKKIAVAASFGIKKEEFLKETSLEVRRKFKQSLETFDLVTVREKDGVDICKDLFNIEAHWIIDPVFWQNRANYSSIAEKCNIDYSDKIISYFFNKTKKDYKNFKQIEKKYNSKIIELYLSDKPIEEWLCAIKNCRLFITNSFHGVCFAIIFNKPFICVVNSVSGISRYESLFEKLGIANQCIYSSDKILGNDCIFKVDYENVNNIIKQEVMVAQNLLVNAINDKTVITEEKINNKIKMLEDKIVELDEKYILKYLLKQKLWDIWCDIFYLLPNFIQVIIKNCRENIKKWK